MLWSWQVRQGHKRQPQTYATLEERPASGQEEGLGGAEQLGRLRGPLRSEMGALPPPPAIG